MADNTKFSSNLTIQSGIKNFDNYAGGDITKYALFMGGLNTTKEALNFYDPLTTGYGRIFMVKKPPFLEKTIPEQLKRFKHIIEYGNTAISGINDINMSFESIRGGYAGKSFEVPTVATDDTNQISITMYEFSGSPIREVVYQWINGVSDFMTGMTTYNGEETLARIQANQTAEFVYVSTDKTGKNVEYACLLTNCFPKNLKNDQFNYSSGEHGIVEYQLEFTCTKYESLQINMLGQWLLNRYKVLANSLNFYSGYENTDEHLGAGLNYDITSGELVDKSSAQTSNKSIINSESPYNWGSIPVQNSNIK